MPRSSGPPPPIDLGLLPVAAHATRDGVFVAVNQKFEELTGWKAADLIGRKVVDVLEKLIAPPDIAAAKELSKNRSSPHPRGEGSFWCRMVFANGEVRPVRTAWRLDENGHDMVAVLLDARPEAYGQEVTEALARVAGSLSRCATEDEVLRRAVDALGDHGFTATVLLWDAKDPLLRYGPSRSPRGLRPELDLPRPPRELLPRLNPAFFERRSAFFADGVRTVREAYPEPVAEHVLTLLPAHRMVQAPIFLGDEPYGALVVTGDALTPLVAIALELFGELVAKAIDAVRLRQERVERERLAALGEAAAVMAHEVRNPIAAIMNAIVLLKRDEASAADRSELLGIISEEANRLAQLVTQLLDLGRPLHPRPYAVAMEELVERAARLLASRGGLPHHALRVPTTKGTVAWLDPTLAELALVNVIQNALQAIGSGGEVSVEVESDPAEVRCIVTDDGRGISDEVLARLGQPFVTTRATGTGVGLAVVRRILEASGGRLVVERRTPQGTTITLAFPRPPETPT